MKTSETILPSLSSRPDFLLSHGLTSHYQILSSLPNLFIFQNHPQLSKIKSHINYIDFIIKYSLNYFNQIQNSFNKNQIIKLLIPIWPSIIKNVQSNKFIQHLKYLQKQLNLGPQHICFMKYYSQKFPQIYPQYCLNYTLQHFQINIDQIQQRQLINIIVGKKCIDALLSINTYKPKQQLQKYLDHSRKQKHISKMTSILSKMLSNTTQILELIQNSIQNKNFPIITILDEWMHLGNNSQCLNIFRQLKIITLLQSLFSYKNTNKSQKPQTTAITNIIKQCSKRLLNRLFSTTTKQKLLILDWILNSQIWLSTYRQSQHLKNYLPSYLIICYQMLRCNQNISANQYLIKIQRYSKQLIIHYLNQIKQKLYISNTLFNSKLPKLYRQINLQFAQFSFNISSNSSSFLHSLRKNTIQPTSVPKLTSKISITDTDDDKQKQHTTQTFKKLTNSQYCKKITYFLNFETQNLAMPNIYILLLLLIQHFSKTTQNQQQTKPQSSLTNIFYRVMKSIQKYQQIFYRNKLSWSITKLISKLTIYFNINTDKCQQFYKPDAPDLNLLQNDSLNLSLLSQKLLKNQLHYSLSAIYQIQYSQTTYNNLLDQQSINKSNLVSKNQQINIQTIKDNYKYKYLISEKDKNNQEISIFINSMYLIAHILTPRPQQIQFIANLLLIHDSKITQILYLNLIFYSILKICKLTTDKQVKKKINQLNKIIKILLSHYFLLTNPKIYQSSIIRILAITYKILQNWNCTTKKNISLKSIGTSPHIYGFFDQKKTIAQIYWEMLISSTQLTNIYQYAKQFQKVNCIKQSIYLMQLYNRRTPSNAHTQQQAKYLYTLCSRLDANLQLCRPYVQDLIGQNTFISNNYLSMKQQWPNNNHKIKEQSFDYNKLKWFPLMRYIKNNRTIDTFASIVYQQTVRICGLQDAQQIIQNLKQISLFSTYYQVLQSKNFEKLHQKMIKINNKDICLSIVKSLIQIKYQLSNNLTQQPKQQSQKIANKLLNIIYNEKLRFHQYHQLQKQLSAINVQDMNLIQIRAAIILCSKIGNYQRVRLYYSRFLADKRPPISMRQQLSFYNMQACYKSIMYYPADKMIQIIGNIVNNIMELASQKINKATTNPLFQALKFICQVYLSLKIEQQKSIIQHLNKYLQKVYSIKNLQLSIQATYFILRFILIQSKHSDILLTNYPIFPYKNYNAKILQPHKFFLICNIGQKANKNIFIKNILLQVALNDPILNSWWLYSLIYHCKISGKNQKLDHIDTLIQQIGSSIYQQLELSCLKLKDHLNWIDWLFTSTNQNFINQKKPIPQHMVSPFSNQVQLISIIGIHNLGQGKSKPVSIQFKAKKNNIYKNVKFIRKIITDNKSGFRTQSATANFFKDSKLLDQGITYSIIHLSKYCLLIQYIEHKATLDSLMTKNMQNTQINKLKTIMQTGDFQGRRVLGKFYDQIGININYALYHFFLNSNSDIIKSWWGKYTNFITTYAQWSYLCYLVGLGDRHSNNILVSQQGKVIHIDFQYIFDTGKMLPYPQWMPFRLTKGLTHQLSIIQPYGFMYSQFIKIAQKFRQRNRQIWYAQSHFSFFKNNDISKIINKRVEFLNIYQQSLKLFKKATSRIQHRDMFDGWGSYK